MKINSEKLKKIACILYDTLYSNIKEIYAIDLDIYLVTFHTENKAILMQFKDGILNLK